MSATVVVVGGAPPVGVFAVRQDVVVALRNLVAPVKPPVAVRATAVAGALPSPFVALRILVADDSVRSSKTPRCHPAHQSWVHEEVLAVVQSPALAVVVTSGQTRLQRGDSVDLVGALG